MAIVEFDQITTTKNTYRNPFLAPLLQCSRLNHPDSTKEILHAVVDLEKFGETYNVGSSFGLIPENSTTAVDELFYKLGAAQRSSLVEYYDQQIPLETFFKKFANLSRISRAHIQLFYDYTKNSTLSSILQDAQQLKTSVQQHTLKSFLDSFWQPSIPIQQLVTISPPMLPRFYSAASSMKHVGKKCEFMISSFRVLTTNGERESLMAQYLKAAILSKNPSVRLFLQPNPIFVLPNTDCRSPIIMIGPGTGLACFRGFLQELAATNSARPIWLFTGDRNRAYDFHYEPELTQYVSSGLLRLSTAFSRDTPNKFYVQHKLLEHKKEIWRWIDDEKAYIYISGNAKQMAKDVQKTLQEIICSEGHINTASSLQYLQRLRETRKLLLDVY